jgi:hypothetical protein
MTLEELKAAVDNLPRPVDLALPGIEEEKAVAIMAYILSVDPLEAREILLMERGESVGDMEEAA